MQSNSGQPITHSVQSGQGQNHQVVNVEKWFHTVPKFRENQVEDFFVYWTTLLHHVLVGKGLEVYNQIGREESADYEYVKEAILRA